ncbi:MAG: hypothetical protein M3Q97_02450 [Bacteroidota bacterium]|nr:hypothetical protein [Bacteroidota bacterium]
MLAVLAAGLVAFLFINGTRSSSALMKEDKSLGHGEKGFDFLSYDKEAKAKLEPGQKKYLDSLDAVTKVVETNAAAKAELAGAYDSLGIPAMAAFYYGQLAQADANNPDYWAKTGDAYFDAQQQVTDSPTFYFFLDKSMEAYDKVLALMPGNLDVKANQGWNLHVASQGNPEGTMKGVGKLREVLQVNPEHRRALLYMGLLSLQSNQVGKAIERFEKLTALPANNDPEYPFYFWYLAEAQMKNKDPEKARQALLTFKSLVKDPRLKEQADALLLSIH